MKAIAMGAMLFASLAHASTAENSCMAQPCHAGDRAVTYATKSDPYFACPTRELAEYANAVIGLLALSVTLTGRMPNISPKTGEPEYLDTNGKPNETRLFMDKLRSDAGVSTFDQAVASCSQGANKRRVTIMNVPKDGTSVWVFDEARKTSFWLPSSSLDRR